MTTMSQGSSPDSVLRKGNCPGMRNNKRVLGNALLMLTAMIWGTAFVFQRVGMEDIEPITFNASRMALAAVAVGAVSLLPMASEKEKLAIMSRKERAEYRRNTIIGGICCGTFLSAASIFQQMGIVYTTAGKAGFITAMYMLLVPVIGFLFLGKLHLGRGDTLVCICAVLFSGHILCCDHFVKFGNPIRISAIQFASCTVISSIAALILEQPSWAKIVSAAIPILYCGLISGGLGYTLQIIAQKYTDPAVASLLMSLESVFAVIAGALLLGERMTGRELLGCVIMFAAIVLVQIRGE